MSSYLRGLGLLCALLMFGACDAAALNTAHPEESRMWMTIGERRFAVTLADTQAARAFAALLPLEIDMADLNGNEKHADLSQVLPEAASRPGTIRNGDLMLYGSNTLVVFYKTFRSSYSYTRLGHVNEPAALEQALGQRSVTIEFSQSKPQKVTSMEIKRRDELQTVTGPAEYFTGNATITGQFQRETPSRISGAIVHFEPGARTAWHTHPLGQTLIVTEGVGWTQIEGGPKLEFYAGDILWCPPEHKHWHGATLTTAMTHIAIQEAKDGSPVTWMEHVTDEQYGAEVDRPHPSR